MRTMVSSRRRASSGLLAWQVDSDPSWPVFMAWSMSSASGPRTSPTTMRSGRMRRALRTSSRMRTSPAPSALAGRASSRTTCSPGQAQLGRVLHGDDPLAVGDAAGEGVEQGGLARARAPRHEDVEPGPHRPRQQGDHRRRGEGGEGDGPGPEAADGEAGTVDRQRGDDGVDPGPVGQAGVDQGRRAVDAQPEGRHHLLDEVLDGGRVEDHGHPLQAPGPLHPHPPRAVDHDLGDVGVGQDRLQGPETAHLGQHLPHHPGLVGGRQQRALARHQLRDPLREPPAGPVGQQPGVDPGLDRSPAHRSPHPADSAFGGRRRAPAQAPARPCAPFRRRPPPTPAHAASRRAFSSDRGTRPARRPASTARAMDGS